MKDRAGFFAGCADALTDMCVYYAAAGILILSGGWGVHLFWLLLCAAACAVMFALLLKEPRTVPFLTAVTAAAFIAVMGVFWLVSTTPMRFGYGFVLAVGAGMAVGLPLYYALRRPLVHKHLARLDVLIIVLAVLLLIREALGIDDGTVALVTAVLFMDAAAAVGLRMSDGETADGGNAFRASMVALAAAAGLALLIALLTVLFSKSGGVTGGVLRGVGSFFTAIGRGIGRFFAWLSSLVTVDTSSELLELEEMPSLAGVETGIAMETAESNAGALGAVAAGIVAAAVVAVTVIFRKRRLSRGSPAAISAADRAVRRTGGTASAVWARIGQRLRFAWTAFVHCDTPAGVFVTLERKGRHIKKPRYTGESMREYINRLDTAGGLTELADALDRAYYGDGAKAMSPQRCRELRRYIRKAV